MDALIPLVVACAILVLPGLVLLWAVRSRLPFLLGQAPPVSALILFVLSALYRVLGIPWTGWTVAAGLALCLIGAVAVAFFLGRFRTRTSGATPGSIAVGRQGWPERAMPSRAYAIRLAGAVAGGALLVVPALYGMGSLGTLNGSYDAFFHHSAVAFIRETGDAFPWTALAPMYEGQSNYYPTTWHMIATLVPAHVVTAANATAIASLAVFPATVIALLDSTLPGSAARLPRAAIIAALGISSAAFLSIPTAVLVMGLWPFGLAVTLLPAAIGALVVLASRSRLGLRTRITALMVVIGTALAHPSVLTSLALVVGVTMIVLGISWLGARDTRRRGAATVTVALALAGIFVWFSTTRIDAMADLTSPEPSTLLTPLLVTLADRPRIQAISFDPLPLAPLLLLAGLGAVRAVLERHRVLLSALAVASTALLLTYAALSDAHWVNSLTAAWYGARERIHPMFEVAVLVLAAGGALWRPPRIGGGWTSRTQRLVVILICCALVAGAVIGAAAEGRLRTIGALAYRSYGIALLPYVSLEEREFIEDAAGDLPPGAVVVGIPQDGTPAFWFLGGVEVTQPSMAPPLTLDVGRVATWGETIAPGSEACEAARNLGVTHLYRDESIFSAAHLGADTDYLYKGYDGIPEVYLTPVAEQGPHMLYRVDLPC